MPIEEILDPDSESGIQSDCGTYREGALSHRAPERSLRSGRVALATTKDHTADAASRRVALVAALAMSGAALAGCDAGGGAGSFRLRAGFTIVHETDGPSLEGTSAWGHRGQAFVVSDVSATRERIVISGTDVFYTWAPTVHVDSFDPYTITGGSGVTGLVTTHLAYVSDDGGATWRDVELQNTDSSLDVQPLGFALAEAGGHAVVAFRSSPSGHVEVRLGDLDLATGIYTSIDVVPPYGEWNRFGDRVGAAYSDSTMQTFWAIYDLDSQTLRQGYTPLPDPSDPDACAAPYYRLTGEERFTGLCVTAAGQSCLVRLDTATATPDVNGDLVLTPEVSGCIPAADLVASFSSSRDRHLFHWGTDAFGSLAEVGGRTVLETRGIFTGVLGPRVDVASAPLWNAAWLGFHHRYEGLAPVGPSDRSPTLYAIEGETEPRLLDLPRTPCIDDAACGTTTLVAVRGLGEQLLLVYDVRTSERSYIVAGMVPRTSGSTPPPGRVSNALARACARATACFPGGELDMHACLDTFAAFFMTGERYDEFVAADDCPTILALLPDFAPMPCTGEPDACVDGVATFCADGRQYRTDCAASGLVCDTSTGAPNCVASGPLCYPSSYTCSGTTLDMCGTTVDCAAQAAECLPGSDGFPACIEPHAACLSTSPACEGDVRLRCELDGYGFRSVDCSRYPGVHCSLGECTPIAAGASCEEDHCEGTHMVFCHQQVTIDVDCADFGLACVTDATRATVVCR